VVRVYPVVCLGTDAKMWNLRCVNTILYVKAMVLKCGTCGEGVPCMLYVYCIGTGADELVVPVVTEYPVVCLGTSARVRYL
jgi:hypothetical protein